VRVSAAVSLRDLAATVQDLAGADGAPFPGHSLARTWAGADADDSPALSMVQRGIRLPRWYPGALGDMRSLVDSGLHVIHGGDSLPELFDLGTDPEEHRNLAADTALTMRMLQRLDQRAPASLIEGHP
jgi:arylsulfatase A-like enzyme